MRMVTLAVLLFVGHPLSAQSPAAPPPPMSSTANPNVVPLGAAAPWWNNPDFDRRVSLVISSVDLDAAVDALGRSANISLIAAGGSKARKKVTLNLRNAPLRDVMLAVANLYGLTWFRTGEVYTLTYVSASAKSLGPSASQLRAPTLKPLRSPATPYRRRRS